jgi:hypothetical protein
VLAALLAGGLALPGPARAQNPPSPGEAQAKARAALADPRFQRDLPEHQENRGTYRAPKPQQSPGEVPEQSPEGEGDTDSRSSVFPSLGIGAAVAKVVFTVLLVAVGGLIVSWIAREVVARRRRSAPPVPAQEVVVEADTPVRIAATFDDASRLAAEGRYAEAVHALLLAAIRHFAARAKTPVQPSRTSRELVRLLPLAPDARDAFADLVRTVELSLFGGGEVAAEDYERSRARFQALTGRAA